MIRLETDRKMIPEIIGKINFKKSQQKSDEYF